MIKIPEGITYAELYFTLRCNLKCDYCINAIDEVVRVRDELDYATMAKAVNNIDFGKISLTIGGGEPTIRKDFYQFMHDISGDVSIDLLSNLQFDVDEFMRELAPYRFTINNNPAYKSIRVSYHPKYMDPVELVRKASRLQQNGYSIGIFGIAHPLNIGYNIRMADISSKMGIYFFVKEYLGYYDEHRFGYYKYQSAISGHNRKVKCRTSELLIDPAGNIYKCHKDLYSIENPIGNIINNDAIEFKYRLCDYFGHCNPCDVKTKINAELEESRCSVEIERRKTDE